MTNIFCSVVCSWMPWSDAKFRNYWPDFQIPVPPVGRLFYCCSCIMTTFTEHWLYTSIILNTLHMNICNTGKSRSWSQAQVVPKLSFFLSSPLLLLFSCPIFLLLKKLVFIFIWKAGFYRKRRRDRDKRCSIC